MKCLKPVWIKETSETHGTYVPCGRCSACVQTKRSIWTFRILQELKGSESAYFTTITYDNMNVPGLFSLKKKMFRILLSLSELIFQLKNLKQVNTLSNQRKQENTAQNCAISPVANTEAKQKDRTIISYSSISQNHGSRRILFTTKSFQQN